MATLSGYTTEAADYGQQVSVALFAYTIYGQATPANKIARDLVAGAGARRGTFTASEIAAAERAAEAAEDRARVARCEAAAKELAATFRADWGERSRRVAAVRSSNVDGRLLAYARRTALEHDVQEYLTLLEHSAEEFVVLLAVAQALGGDTGPATRALSVIADVRRSLRAGAPDYARLVSKLEGNTRRRAAALM